MSIYVGDKKFDLHYTTTGNKVNRSVFKGENKLWPLYEFSFYDGSMQKTIENIPASGKTENIKIRSCEDSWWHKLKFDEIYVFGKTSADSWLKYNATKFNCKNVDNVEKVKQHWLSVINGTNYSVNPDNSDSKQTISFNDHYNKNNVHISDISNSGGTCRENVHDIDMLYTIDKNEWFIDRFGYMYGKQYDEWDHISGSTRKDNHFYDLSPSDNTPTIYISQLANSWGNNKQHIEFTCSSENVNASGGDVTLTWRIYSNSTSGTTIYYGSNIASNNGTKEYYGEIYREGYMWITTSNPNVTLNTDSVKKTISENGVVTWTMTATYSSNESLENSSSSSHNISFKGFPSSIDANGGTYTISAVCAHDSVNIENVFTLNLSSKNNWRPGSATCKCNQNGNTTLTDCCVSTSNSFDPCQTSVTITVKPISSSNKVYSLSVDKSSVSTEDNKFTVKSYYTQNSVDGEDIIVYAKCKYSNIVTSKSISQSSLSGSNGPVGFTTFCNGREILDPSTVLATDLEDDFTKTITVEPHSTPGDTVNNIITVKQNESNKIVTLVHIPPSKVEYKYEYKITLFDNEDNAKDESNKTPTTNVTINYDVTTTTIYARLEEKCITIKDGAITPNGDPNEQDASYDYIVIKNTKSSHSGVTLSNFTNFVFNGGENVDKTEKWENSNISIFANYISLTITGKENNDVSNESSYCQMDMVLDNVSTIQDACDMNSDAFSFKFSLNETVNVGGYTRIGSFTASYANAKALCNWSQKSKISSTNTSSPLTGKSNDILLEFEPSDYFDKKNISESNGEYTVNVKTLSDFYANSNPQFIDYLESEYEITADSDQNVTVNSATDTVNFGVVVKGDKYYTEYIDNNGNVENTRSVMVTASYEYNGETKSVITSIKTQDVCKHKDTSQKYIISNPDVVWTASEQNTSFYSDYNPKEGDKTSVSIVNKSSGSTTEEKTIDFTATLNDTGESVVFSITWPKDNIVSTTWNYNINISISLSNSCDSSTFYLSINDTKIDNTEITVLPGSNNSINYTSEEITATDVKVTVKLYKNTDELVEDYGEHTFTINANTLYKYYSENCESEEIIYNINITSNTSYTVCPSTTIEITFTITDADNNYYSFSDVGLYEIDNEEFKINENISYKDNINTIKVTTSDINGDTAKLILSVNDGDNKITNNITITNKITYACGGIEEVQ